MQACKALTGSLMVVGCQLVLLLITRVTGLDRGILALPLALAGGGACAGAAFGRLLRARWPEHLVAGLLGTAWTMLVTIIVLPAYSPIGGGAYPGAWLDKLVGVMAFLAVGAMGAFALPLADSTVRKEGPAPRISRVTGGAAALLGSLALAIWLLMPGGGPGSSYFVLSIFAAGAVIGMIGTGVATLLTLLGRTAAGAWLGAVSLLTALAALVLWLAGGWPWFP